MARALFVCQYADEVESGELQLPGAGPGQDWMDVAPATPQPFIFEAYRLAGRIEQLNGTSLICLAAAARKADMAVSRHADATWAGQLPDSQLSDFGHYLAMQSLGHGVSGFDDHEKFPLRLPHVEVLLDLQTILK
jgi:hypothetical protein